MPLFLIYVPLIYFSLKNAGFFLHAGVAIFLALMGRSAGFHSLEFLVYLLNGVVFAYVFAYAYKRKLPLFYVVALPLLTQILFMVLCDTVPAYHNAYTELIKTTTVLVNKAFHLPPASAAVESLQWRILMPVSELLKQLLTVLVLAYCFYRVAGREKPKFSDLEIPYGFVWVFAAGLLLTLFHWIGETGFYVLASAVLLYLLAGFAIVRLFFERMGRSRMSEVIFYLVQPGLLFVPVFTIGLMENWWDFRSRIEAMNSDADSNDSNDNNNQIS